MENHRGSALCFLSFIESRRHRTFSTANLFRHARLSTATRPAPPSAWPLCRAQPTDTRPAQPLPDPARPGPLTRGSSSSLARGAVAPAPVRLGAASGTRKRWTVRSSAGQPKLRGPGLELGSSRHDQALTAASREAASYTLKTRNAEPTRSRETKLPPVRLSFAPPLAELSQSALCRPRGWFGSTVNYYEAEGLRSASTV